MPKNILLVGVGGQGTILASKLLTTGLMKSGYDVKMSEIHGMSQRGGSVSSQVRYGKKVYSPVIEEGSADILVSFEKMEAIRWMSYLKKDGIVLVNKHRINPMPVLNGKYSYDEVEIDNELKKLNSITIDAIGEAMSIGNEKVMNIVLLGALVKLMELESIDWESIISENVKYNFIEINIKAFNKGKEIVTKKAVENI